MYAFCVGDLDHLIFFIHISYSVLLFFVVFIVSFIVSSSLFCFGCGISILFFGGCINKSCDHWSQCSNSFSFLQISYSVHPERRAQSTNVPYFIIIYLQWTTNFSSIEMTINALFVAAYRQHIGLCILFFFSFLLHFTHTHSGHSGKHSKCGMRVRWFLLLLSGDKSFFFCLFVCAVCNQRRHKIIL